MIEVTRLNLVDQQLLSINGPNNHLLNQMNGSFRQHVLMSLKADQIRKNEYGHAPPTSFQ